MPATRLSSDRLRALARRYPLLATKLYAPPISAETVSRSRLVQQLNQDIQRPVIVVSAPAGYGKTTLIGQWLAQGTMPVAWVSLDASDNDPVRFWFHLIAALISVYPEMSEQIADDLVADGSTPVTLKLTPLINEIAAGLDHPIALVLDDYHVIEAPEVHQGVAFLIEHLPSSMHLILLTRTEPPLPLARLRANAQLAEFRTADLRFSLDEMAAFLEQAASLAVSDDHLKLLDSYLEGWVAGLRLVALSSQTGRDFENLIRSLSGGHRYIGDYLAEEVLLRQPEPLRRFLLQTSILERLNPVLCSAVTGAADSAALLRDLAARNLFVIPLDDQQHWYRYHHLFAEFLHRQLEQQEPQTVTDLHRRASAWYEYNGFSEQAITHALAAHEDGHAAALIMQVAPAMLNEGRLTTLDRWLGQLPDSILEHNPPLSLIRAQVLISKAHMEEAEPYLLQAEKVLRAAEASLGPEDTLRLGQVMGSRALLASARGDIDRTLEFSRQAQMLLPVDNQQWQCTLNLGIGIAHFISGSALQAVPALKQAYHLARATPRFAVAVSAGANLGTAYLSLGELRAAERLFRDVLEYASGASDRPLTPLGAWAQVGLADILYEWDDLDAAYTIAEAAEDLSAEWSLTGARVRANAVIARISFLRGDYDTALVALDRTQGEEGTHYINPADSRLWSVTQGWIALARGDLAGASEWAQKARLTTIDTPKPHRVLEYILLARMLLQQGDPQLALSLVDQIIASEMTAGRMYAVTAARAVRVLALNALSHPGTLAELADLLQAAEPEGYIRTFLDLGQPMLKLLLSAQDRGITFGYVKRILDAQEGSAAPASAPIPSRGGALSDREMEILRLLATGLSSREIADELVITFHTARTHVKNIYSKLDAHSRLEAVDNARRLNLL